MYEIDATLIAGNRRPIFIVVAVITSIVKKKLHTKSLFLFFAGISSQLQA
jgi:hypothetical protein